MFGFIIKGRDLAPSTRIAEFLGPRSIDRVIYFDVNDLYYRLFRTNLRVRAFLSVLQVFRPQRALEERGIINATERVDSGSNSCS